MMNKYFAKIREENIRYNLINLPHLVFEVTDLCNLNCKYCGYGELYEGYDTRGRGKLSIFKARNILDYLSEFWKNNIDSSLVQPLNIGFYGGEPLIGMDLIKDIIAYTESLNIINKKFYYNMTTNALLLSKHMDFIVEKEIRLLISLDGDEKGQSYRVNRNGQNSHKQVIENVELLQRTYPEYFKKNVKFNSVLHDKNSVESAHSYIKDKFGKETRISHLNNSGIKKEKIPVFRSMFQSVNFSIEKSCHCDDLEAELFLEAPKISKLVNYFYLFSGNMFDNYSSFFMDDNTNQVIPTGTCVPFSKKMFISVNGKILQCEKINHEFVLGYVYDDMVDLDFCKIASKANDYISRLIKQCNTCAYKKRCAQCVYQIDEINNTNPICFSHLGNTAFKDVISQDLGYLGKHPDLYKKIMKNVQIRNK